jgi:hypothetical protein
VARSGYSKILKEILGEDLDMAELVTGVEEWEEWEDDPVGTERVSRMSQREERALWRILEECDAKQAREEKVILKTKTKKVEKARSKMMVGKNQPSIDGCPKSCTCQGWS